MKLSVLASTLVTVLACGAPQAQQAPVALHIDAQPLDRALTTWANQTGYQILLLLEGCSAFQAAPSISGTYTPEGALKLLLASSGLTYEYVGARTIAIRPVSWQLQPNGGRPAPCAQEKK